ncbi:MAG: type II and III secretion system protein [Chthoniobacter sp.]|nr:type II and III secretion system protein [Chthoniobacter sp.]
MKTLLLRLCVLLALCTASSPAQEDAPVSRQVTFDFLVVELPEPTVLPLLPDLRDRKRASDATKRILKLVAEKKAVLIAWPVLTTRSGQRAVVEQIDELRYASEYEAPGKTKITDNFPSAAGTPGAPVVPVDPKEARPAPPTLEHTTTTDSTSEGVPSGFDVRRVGVTLEIEPVIAPDGTSIDLNLVPEYVRFLGMEKAVLENLTKGTKVEVQQPRFATNKITTSLTVVSGDYTLLSVFKNPGTADRIVLFILHSEIELLPKTPPAPQKAIPRR